MNTRNLVTSLSQQLDTSCTEFPDGFEETQQLQVSLLILSNSLINFKPYSYKIVIMYKGFDSVANIPPAICSWYVCISTSSRAICLNKCKIELFFSWTGLVVHRREREGESEILFFQHECLLSIHQSYRLTSQIDSLSALLTTFLRHCTSWVELAGIYWSSVQLKNAFWFLKWEHPMSKLVTVIRLRESSFFS